MVRRHTTRVADQRLEARFPPPAEALGGLRLSDQQVGLHDVSASGLRLAAELTGAIGAEVEVAFAGYPPITGRIVWVRDGATGVRLPDNALDLFEAA